MASVTLKHVKKIFPQTKIPAVNDINLEIKDKEFIVLVGPSGCGKTTTLRMIAGLENLSEGEIFIGKQAVNEVEPKDRDVAMVFQNYALYPHMSVYDNIAFALKRRLKNKSEIDKKVREAAKILGLTEFLKRKPKDLSGGQRQRVAIGRAIVRNPKVMLMDEPLSNLDTILRTQMRTELIALRKKIKTTFVYVTHDQTEAMTLGDRIVVMNNGTIQQIGTPQEVFSNPANIFVASFIGTPQMNFFDAQLVKTDNTYKVVMGNFHTNVSKKQSDFLRKNNTESCDIVLGVRPESLQMTNNKISFSAKIDMVEMMGASVILHLSHNKEKALLVTQSLDKNGKLKMDYQSGSEISFRFVPEAMHLFDKNTGNSLLQ